MELARDPPLDVADVGGPRGEIGVGQPAQPDGVFFKHLGHRVLGVDVVAFDPELGVTPQHRVGDHPGVHAEDLGILWADPLAGVRLGFLGFDPRLIQGVIESRELGRHGISGDGAWTGPDSAGIDHPERTDGDTRTDGDPSEGLHHRGRSRLSKSSLLRSLFLPILRFVELRDDQVGQRRDGLLGVGSSGFQVQLSSAFGRKRHQVENAFAVDRLTIGGNPDLGLKAVGKLHKLVGGAKVHPQRVRDLDLAAGYRGIVAHRWLDRPRGQAADIPARAPEESTGKLSGTSPTDDHHERGEASERDGAKRTVQDAT